MDPVWQAVLIMGVGLGFFGLYWYSIWAPEVRGEVKIVAGGFEFSDGKKTTPCEWGELSRAWLYSEYDLRVKVGLQTLRMDPRCMGMAEFLPMARGKLGEAFLDFPAAAANLARAAARHRAGEPASGEDAGAFLKAGGRWRGAELGGAWMPPKAALAQAFQSLQTQPLVWGQAGLLCAGLWGGTAAVFNSGLIFYAEAFKGLFCLGCLAFFYYFPPRRRRILSLAAAAIAGFFFWRFYETTAGGFAEEMVRVASKSALPDIRREGLTSLIPFRVRLEDAEEDIVTGFDNYFKIKPGDTGRARVFSRGRTVYLESFQKL